MRDCECFAMSGSLGVMSSLESAGIAFQKLCCGWELNHEVGAQVSML